MKSHARAGPKPPTNATVNATHLDSLDPRWFHASDVAVSMACPRPRVQSCRRSASRRVSGPLSNRTSRQRESMRLVGGRSGHGPPKLHRGSVPPLATAGQRRWSLTDSLPPLPLAHFPARHVIPPRKWHRPRSHCLFSSSAPRWLGRWLMAFRPSRDILITTQINNSNSPRPGSVPVDPLAAQTTTATSITPCQP